MPADMPEYREMMEEESRRYLEGNYRAYADVDTDLPYTIAPNAMYGSN